MNRTTLSMVAVLVLVAGCDASRGVLTVATLLEGFKADEKSWMGKKVKLEGVYFSTSTSASGGKPTIQVSVAASKEDIKNTVGCEVASDPGVILQYTPVVIEGTVDKGFGPRLKDCTLRKKS